MNKKTKIRLKEVIDNLDEDENVLLITNDTCCIVGTIRNIFTNIVLASLNSDGVKQLMELIKKLERGNEK